MNHLNLRLLGVAAAASMVVAGCATPQGARYGTTAPGYGSTAACYDCGTVARIDQVGGSGAPAATGAVLGGLVGAAAGRELGDSTAATVGGAVAGAVAGSAIQKRVSGARYNVSVRMDDGRTTVVTQNDLDGVREGSYVRVYNGRAWVR